LLDLRRNKMSNCIKDCKLCRNIVISTAVTVITIGGTDTLVIDIPAGFYPDCRRVCLVVAQTIPTAATINMPVAISIGGDTTTVYPIVNCDCSQITACAIHTRTKYGLCISTSATSAVFKSLKKLNCYPAETLAVIPASTTAGAAVVNAPVAVMSTRKTTKEAAKNE
jgi:hypothetical protein